MGKTLNVQLPKRVSIMEVGPRDGLQNEKIILNTADKITFIEHLVSSGIKRIEITSFVSPKWIPPLADQVEVAQGIKRQHDVAYAALIPNMKGYERAVENAVNEVSLVIAATDSHNKKNLNASTEEVLARYREVCARAVEDALKFRVYISCSFGCPYEGKVPFEKVVRLAEIFAELGAYEISVSDTIGIGNPQQTGELLRVLKQSLPIHLLGLHMHDTRGLGLANIFVGLIEGISNFDASAGGLGGCPYAHGASGNVATEDLLNMMHELGIETGIAIDGICAASQTVEKILGRELPAKMLRLYKDKKAKSLLLEQV